MRCKSLKISDSNPFVQMDKLENTIAKVFYCVSDWFYSVQIKISILSKASRTPDIKAFFRGFSFAKK